MRPSNHRTEEKWCALFSVVWCVYVNFIQLHSSAYAKDFQIFSSTRKSWKHFCETKQRGKSKEKHKNREMSVILITYVELALPLTSISIPSIFIEHQNSRSSWELEKSMSYSLYSTTTTTHRHWFSFSACDFFFPFSSLCMIQPRSRAWLGHRKKKCAEIFCCIQTTHNRMKNKKLFMTRARILSSCDVMTDVFRESTNSKQQQETIKIRLFN